MGQSGSDCISMPNCATLSVFLPVVLPQPSTADVSASLGTVRTTFPVSRTRSPE